MKRSSSTAQRGAAAKKKCVVCARPVMDWPLIFRSDDACSDVCRKRRLVLFDQAAK